MNSDKTDQTPEWVKVEFDAPAAGSIRSGSGSGKSMPLPPSSLVWVIDQGQLDSSVGLDAILDGDPPGRSPNEIAFFGACRVVAEPGRWGGAYSSEVLHSPTWGDLELQLKEQSIETADLQHAFLEGFELQEDQPEPDISHLKLVLGS